MLRGVGADWSSQRWVRRARGARRREMRCHDGPPRGKRGFGKIRGCLVVEVRQRMVGGFGLRIPGRQGTGLGTGPASPNRGRSQD